MLKAALEARKKKSQDAKDVSLSLSLAGKDKASLDSSSLSLSLAGTDTTGTDTTKDRSDSGYDGLKQSALLLGCTTSLTQEEKADMRNKIREANPGASSEEIKSIFKAAVLDAALEAQKRKEQAIKG
jgi:hypothetical protein